MNIRYDEKLIETVRALMPSFLSGKRLAHTYAVEKECAALAGIFRAFPMLFSAEEEGKLRVAALLHDITKEKTLEEHCALCTKYHIPLTDYEKAAPKVLHAKTGAAVAAEAVNTLLGWNAVDDAISHAILTHTTGDAHMSLLGKLLYLADYIEETRTWEDCITLRRTFYAALDKCTDASALVRHLDATLILSFDMTIHDLIEQHALIDPNTTAARNALVFAGSHPI